MTPEEFIDVLNIYGQMLRDKADELFNKTSDLVVFHNILMEYQGELMNNIVKEHDL